MRQGFGLPTSGLTVRLDEAPTDEWAHVLNAGQHNGDASAELEMMARVRQRSAFVTAYDADEPVAIGRAVVEHAWTGVFHLATVPNARGRGVARLVLDSIFQWAHSINAAHLYLQVERSNTSARRLYASAGFEHCANYHYRVRSRHDERARPKTR